MDEVALFCAAELQKSTNDAQTLHLMAFIRSVISARVLNGAFRDDVPFRYEGMTETAQKVCGRDRSRV